MNLEVARVGLADTDEWSHVVSWVYRRAAPSVDTYAQSEGETRFLVRADGIAAAACTVYPMDLVIGASTVRCGAVAGVATLPEHRRIGAADALMRRVVDEMREGGYCLSGLYPFRAPYYRRFGYENCGWRWQIKCPAERLPSFRASLPVRQLTVDDLTELDSVYVPFVRARSGSPLRAKEDWEHRLGKTTPMVYGIGEPFEAYLWVNLEEFWGDANIGEIAWTSQAGYETAMSLIGGLCSNQSSATWNEPPDSPFIANWMDQGVTATLSRPTMFRILDVQRLVQSLACDDNGEFCMQVTDDVCPWNAGTWTVKYSPDECTATKGGVPGFVLDIKDLAQAVMGQPGLDELAAFGRVTVNDALHVTSALSLFPRRPVVCMEFF